MNSYLCRDGLEAAREREALGIDLVRLAGLVGCRTDLLEAFEVGLYRPTVGFKFNLTFALHTLFTLKNLGVPLDDAEQVDRLFNWLYSDRDPEEVARTKQQMAAADELAGTGE
jgi:hypothetical protein